MLQDSKGITSTVVSWHKLYLWPPSMGRSFWENSLFAEGKNPLTIFLLNLLFCFLRTFYLGIKNHSVLWMFLIFIIPLSPDLLPNFLHDPSLSCSWAHQSQALWAQSLSFSLMPSLSDLKHSHDFSCYLKCDDFRRVSLAQVHMPFFPEHRLAIIEIPQTQYAQNEMHTGS